MSPVHADDLPPALRRQVIAQSERLIDQSEAVTDQSEAVARDVPRKPAANTAEMRRGSREALAKDRGPAYRCCACGEVFPHYGAPAERHADTHGGARLEAVL